MDVFSTGLGCGSSFEDPIFGCPSWRGLVLSNSEILLYSWFDDLVIVLKWKIRVPVVNFAIARWMIV